MLQEPFCPPKPSMPSPAVTPSTYLDDLVKLFEVIQSSFCVFFHGKYFIGLQKYLKVYSALLIFRTRARLTSSWCAAVWASQATSSSYPQVRPLNTTQQNIFSILNYFQDRNFYRNYSTFRRNGPASNCLLRSDGASLASRDQPKFIFCPIKLLFFSADHHLSSCGP